MTGGVRAMPALNNCFSLTSLGSKLIESLAKISHGKKLSGLLKTRKEQLGGQIYVRSDRTDQPEDRG